MAEVNITINGRTYGISCEDGQEKRVHELGKYVDARLKEIAKAGAASSESHLLVLTSLMLSDEIFDLRSDVRILSSQLSAAVGTEEKDETEVALAIGMLADRIERIASRIQNA